MTRLRAAGAFRAQPMETLLVTSPPSGVVRRTVFVIGQGDPAALDGDMLRRATRVAMREAIRFRARSMAFAPSVLDGGHTNNIALDMQEVMLGTLRAEHMLADAGPANRPVLRHCTFDVGAPRAHAAGLAFATAFARLTAQALPGSSGA